MPSSELVPSLVTLWPLWLRLALDLDLLDLDLVTGEERVPLASVTWGDSVSTERRTWVGLGLGLGLGLG